MARGLKFRIKEVEGLYYPCSENKGADQLRGYREADMRHIFLVFAYAKSRFSHEAAHLKGTSNRLTMSYPKLSYDSRKLYRVCYSLCMKMASTFIRLYNGNLVIYCFIIYHFYHFFIICNIYV